MACAPEVIISSSSELNHKDKRYLHGVIIAFSYKAENVPYIHQSGFAIPWLRFCSQLDSPSAGLLAMRTLVCKLVAVAFSMGGGLIAGKDGPLIHGGGIVGGGLAGMGSR